jgi:hypothetical protein
MAMKSQRLIRGDDAAAHHQLGGFAHGSRHASH